MKKIMSSLAQQFVGMPYRWGGDDTIAGFDCSGFVIELLKSVGILPRSGDWTAHGLYNIFKGKKVLSPKEGCLVFYTKHNVKDERRINHVEYVWKKGLTIGASGGGSKTITKEDAIKQNAYIKARPLRRPYFAIVDPFRT